MKNTKNIKQTLELIKAEKFMDAELLIDTMEKGDLAELESLVMDLESTPNIDIVLDYIANLIEDTPTPKKETTKKVASTKKETTKKETPKKKKKPSETLKLNDKIKFQRVGFEELFDIQVIYIDTKNVICILEGNSNECFVIPKREFNKLIFKNYDNQGNDYDIKIII